MMIKIVNKEIEKEIIMMIKNKIAQELQSKIQKYRRERLQNRDNED